MKYVLFLVLFVLSFAQLYAQPPVRIPLDTVYPTQNGYYTGDSATIFFPAIPNGAAVIAVHWLGGVRSIMDAWCDTLAAHGYLAMTIDYPDPINPPAVQFPEQVRDVKFAVQFLRRLAHRFSIDTNKIYGLGNSLGSILIGEALIRDNDAAYFGTDPNISDHFNAVALLYGLYDCSNYLQSRLAIPEFIAHYFPGGAAQRDSNTPVLHAGNIMTPLFLLHGSSDNTIQYQQSVEMNDSLTAHKKPHELLLFQGEDHAFDLTTAGDFTSPGLIAKDSVLAYFTRAMNSTTAVPETSYPSDYALYSAYPNPFASSTTISYALPTAEDVSLKVYNTLGEEVATLANGEMAAGEHSGSFNGRNVQNGLYFYRLSAGKFSQTGTMIVLH